MEVADNWYKSSLEVYNRRTKADTVLIDFLHNKAESFRLNTKRRCLSIGPGTGDVDVPLLASHCPELLHYIAVEPNGEEARVLRERLYNEVKHVWKLKLEIIPDSVESWKGPDEQVDLILMVHVLYHIKDPKTLFKRCRQWLSPGGVMVIVQGGQNIFLPVAEKFDVAEEMYRAKHIHDDLVELDFNDLKMEAVYTEFDIRDRDKDLMNFLLLKQATDEELAALDAFLTEIMPTGIEEHDAWILWWTKP